MTPDDDGRIWRCMQFGCKETTGKPAEHLGDKHPGVPVTAGTYYGVGFALVRGPLHKTIGPRRDHIPAIDRLF